MILLRHGQSEFNLHFSRTRIDPGIEDPRLTPLGHEQAERAAAALAGAGLRRIVVSPYTRALQTAAPIARALRLPVTVTTAVRERYAFKCDTGSHRSILVAEWPHHDFAAIEERWWPTEEEPTAGVLARAAAFRAEWAADADRRAEAAHTLVVSHWGFILSLTGQSVGNGDHVSSDPAAPAPAEIVWKH